VNLERVLLGRRMVEDGWRRQRHVRSRRSLRPEVRAVRKMAWCGSFLRKASLGQACRIFGGGVKVGARGQGPERIVESCFSHGGGVVSMEVRGCAGEGTCGGVLTREGQKFGRGK